MRLSQSNTQHPTKALHGLIASRRQNAVHVMAATLLVVMFTTESNAQGTYEFHSQSLDEVFATIVITVFPSESLESIDSLTLLDPSVPNYMEALPLHEAELIGTITESQAGRLGGEAEIKLSFPQHSINLPSYMDPDTSLIQAVFRDRVGRDELVWDVFAGNGDYQGDWRLVPEPATHLLLLTAILGRATVQWRRRTQR